MSPFPVVSFEKLVIHYNIKFYVPIWITNLKKFTCNKSLTSHSSHTHHRSNISKSKKDYWQISIIKTIPGFIHAFLSIPQFRKCGKVWGMLFTRKASHNRHILSFIHKKSSDRGRKISTSQSEPISVSLLSSISWQESSVAMPTLWWEGGAKFSCLSKINCIKNLSNSCEYFFFPFYFDIYFTFKCNKWNKCEHRHHGVW